MLASWQGFVEFFFLFKLFFIYFANWIANFSSLTGRTRNLIFSKKFRTHPPQTRAYHPGSADHHHPDHYRCLLWGWQRGGSQSHWGEGSFDFSPTNVFSSWDFSMLGSLDWYWNEVVNGTLTWLKFSKTREVHSNTVGHFKLQGSGGKSFSRGSSVFSPPSHLFQLLPGGSQVVPRRGRET